MCPRGQIAVELRQKFQCDVYIDLYCYRKYGHNEGDEPTFTQPHEYALIKAKRSIREIFRDQLIKEKVLDEAKAQEFENAFRQGLQQALDSVKALAEKKPPEIKVPKEQSAEIKTAVDKQTLVALAERFSIIPEDFRIHPKIQHLLKDRLAMVHADPNKRSIDWGMGEHLALPLF